jgi:hypothetical protein
MIPEKEAIPPGGFGFLCEGGEEPCVGILATVGNFKAVTHVDASFFGYDEDSG